ncbi:MAG TPA: HypC/HybG/HupF family hydrogenase formation chaperone [Solirubrobacteraceae bacterium]
MSEALPACIADFDGCITCGDHAVELRVVSVDEQSGLAVCADEHGGSAEVDVLLVAPVAPGERLLVHAGAAIGRGAAA